MGLKIFVIIFDSIYEYDVHLVRLVAMVEAQYSKGPWFNPNHHD
jgi:hypothetical protein